MKNIVALLSAVSVLSGVAALAAPPKTAKKDTKKPVASKTAKPAVQTAKLTEVWTCPVTGEAIKDHKAENGKPAVVGNYRVHFCCPGCDTSFAKMSAADQKTKAMEAAKKDTEAAKGAKAG